MNRSVTSARVSPVIGLLWLVVALFQPDGARAQNLAPTISGTPATSVTVAAKYYFRPMASDPNGNTLRFYVRQKPVWASFDTATGTLSGAPTAAHIGLYSGIRIFVTDGVLVRGLPGFSITVKGATATTNSAPRISGAPSTSAVVGQAYAFQPTASDPDGNTLTFSIVNKPVWATFSTSTGRLSGTPGTSNVGTVANITIRVSDGTTTTSLAPFSMTVTQPVNNSVTLRWTSPTTNTDGTPLTDLTDFRVFYGQVSGQYNFNLRTGTPTITAMEIQGLAPGTWYFTVKAVNSRGVESDFAREASKTLL